MMRSWIVRTPDYDTAPSYYEPPDCRCDECVAWNVRHRAACAERRLAQECDLAEAS